MAKLSFFVAFFFIYISNVMITVVNAEVSKAETGNIVYAANSEFQALFEEAVDYAHQMGVQFRIKDHRDKSDVLGVAPVTLFPSAVPRKLFEQANALQETLNLLYFRVSCDQKFLMDQLNSGLDSTIKLLADMAWEAQAEGHQLPIKLFLERADYMFHSTVNDPKVGPTHELKQIEVNIGSVGGLVNDRVTQLHRRMVSKAGIDRTLLPQNNAINTFAQAFYVAWQKFNNPDAIMLLVHEEQSTMATPEQRHLQYEIERISKEKMKVIRISVQACAERLSLADDFSLLLDDQVVAIVYFRISFMGPNSAAKMQARQIIERSTAIKAPSLPQELASAKKIQQVLAQPGMLEKFLHEPEHAKNIEAIRNTFAGLWGLEGEDEKTKAVIQDAIDHPERYVLKPNREGGGHNIWDDEISTSLQKFTPDELAGHILMQKLNPLIVQNFFLRPLMPLEFGNVINELSIFGALVGDEKDGKIHYNKGHGHMVRTKWAHLNEAGVIKGTGANDTPLLF